VQEC